MLCFLLCLLCLLVVCCNAVTDCVLVIQGFDTGAVEVTAAEIIGRVDGEFAGVLVGGELGQIPLDDPAQKKVGVV